MALRYPKMGFLVLIGKIKGIQRDLIADQAEDIFDIAIKKI
ncbi:MAG: hypothetical protein ACJA01_001878 [Saprospiraceae bacterium]|jgi:hypothetical protein